MSKKAERLRQEAAALEAQEEADGIKARCRAGDYTWDRHGRCFREYHEFVPCPGQPQYRLAHYASYTDEYGSWDFCPVCRGSGRIFTTHRLREPQYDAPRPPAE